MRSVYQQQAYPESARFWGDMVFTADNDDLTFGRVLERWMALHRKAGDVIDFLVGLLYAPPLFYETRFILAVLAAEGYHRRLFRQSETSQARRRRERILTACNEVDAQWLKGVLPAGPSFANRIDQLMDAADGPLVPLLATVPRFRSRVRVLRNLYVHQLESTHEPRATGEELFRLTLVLKYLLQACILRELGLDDRTKLSWHYATRHPRYAADVRSLGVSLEGLWPPEQATGQPQ